jgi:hypothetical protein
MRLPQLIISALFSGGVALAALHGGSAEAGDGVCRGPALQAGQSIHGPILRVIDAHTLCVALAPDPSTWVPVALADPAPTRKILMAAAFAKNATCVIDADGRGVCDIEGEKLADLVQQPGIVQASMEWR